MAVLLVKVIPKSSVNAICGFEGEILKVRVRAVAKKGYANDELIELLAWRLKIAKSRISIKSGHHSRQKKLLIEGVSDSDLTMALDRLG